MNKNIKRLIAVILAGGVIAGGVGGSYVFVKKNAKVNVYPVAEISENNSWADWGSESNGIVTNSGVQSVYLSGSQNVREIFVKEGDTVKKGDLLISYDTTLKDIDLSRKDVAIKQLELDISVLEKALKTKKRSDLTDGSTDVDLDFGDDGNDDMTAMAAPANSDGDAVGVYVMNSDIGWSQIIETDPGAITAAADISPEEKGGFVPMGMIRTSSEVGDPGSGPESSSAVDDPGITSSDVDPDPDPTSSDVDPTPGPGESSDAPSGPSSDPSSGSEGSEVIPDGDVVTTFELLTGAGTKDKPLWVQVASGYEMSLEDMRSLVGDEPTYVIFVTAEGDGLISSETQASSRNGMILTRDGDDLSIKFFDQSGYTMKPSKPVNPPSYPPVDPGWGGGGGGGVSDIMSKEELAQLKEVLAEKNLALRKAVIEYKEMKKELDNTQVTASIDGVVLSAITDPDHADSTEPIIKISNGGSYHIESTLTEFEKADVKIGDTVTITSYMNGNTYTGEITEIGDTPTTAINWINGNSNTSSYRYIISVGDEADLQDGEYVSLKRNQEEVEDTSGKLYLDNMFVVLDGNNSYVYVENSEGRIEKRTVVTGGSVYGSYTIITGGLSPEEYIAPNFTNTKEGAIAVESTLDQMYRY